MSDYASVTLTVTDLTKVPQVEALIAELELFFDDSDPEVGWFEAHEARWGSNYLDELATAMREAGIGYRLQDWGHYTWSPSEEAWEPGIPGLVMRQTDIEGNPVFDRWDLARVEGQPVDDTTRMAMIRSHFEDDPTKWAGCLTTELASA